ncbi:MAG: amidohydrolase [Myxococcota bacterium]
MRLVQSTPRSLPFSLPCVIASAVSVFILGGCAIFSGEATLDSGGPADIVFQGGKIYTVDDANEGATAVAVRGDTIVAVGDAGDMRGLIGESTRVVELGDGALTPGFIDAHGHLSMVMVMLDLLNVSSPPVGPMESVEDIVAALKARIDELEIPPGTMVAGYGYDDSLLAEGRHPTRRDLDRASSEHPILLMHVSGHLTTLNSQGLAWAGLDASSENPPGGVIRREAGSRVPNGVLEEVAATLALTKAFTASGAISTPQGFMSALSRAIDYHASFGITTIQDGASNLESVAGLRGISAMRPLAVDVAAYPVGNAMGDGEDLASFGYTKDYKGGFRVAGVKFVLDGSPQGRTAWMSEPYDEGPPGHGSDYVAYPIIEPEHYLKQSARLLQAGIPIIVHSNGDAAIDLMIQSVDEAFAGGDLKDHRSVTIHGQLTRKDQLDSMARLNIIPSFFSAHSFFWGDWHRRSFGDDRAMSISPTASALSRGVTFTLHNDAPVVPPHILRLLEITVDRRTRDGVILGEDERISFREALKGVTINAAYSYFEEGRKGSISVGKQADLVVLGADPEQVPTQQISEIEILETIARGKTVYSAEAP